jgi:ligand-binding sensor domain-containing protein/two-component sensor histidine kinase
MQNRILLYLVLITLLTSAGTVLSQDVFFNRVLPPEGKVFGHVTGIVQDRQGYMWLTTKSGLFRYDGYEMINFKHNPLDTNSLASDALEAICTDAAGAIWIATIGAGLERLDPQTGVITHFRHQPNNPASLSADGVTAVLVDREGVLWVGTNNGLNRFVASSGKFVHYRNQPNDPKSISSNSVVALHEDRQGVLWVGTGSVYNNNPKEGGLNCLDKKTGTFTRFQHDPKNPNTLIDNRVRAILEDSRGIFWVGTAGDGLHTLDRKTATFQRHRYDPAHPEKLSRPPIHKVFGQYDHITFINEDAAGAIWIGTSESGLNYFNPETKKIVHYESEKDTVGAFTSRTGWSAFTSREGMFWIGTLHGELFRANPFKRTIPFYPSSDNPVFSFYEETNGTLWKGTDKGLIQYDLQNGMLKWLVNNPLNKASPSHNPVMVVKVDHQGNIWVGTSEGLLLLDKKRGAFTRYRHDPKNSASLSNDIIRSYYEDSKNNLWIGTFRGLNRMDRKTGSFKLFLFYPEDTTFCGPNLITSVLEDRQGQIWAGSFQRGGIHQLNPVSGKFKTYLKEIGVYSIYEDASGTLWAGGGNGLFFYNRKSDTFDKYVDPNATIEINSVSSIIGDDLGNLWIGTPDGLLKINPQRNQTTIYGKGYGVDGNQFIFNSAYKGNKGKIYFGHERGYYAFSPDLLTKGLKPPEILFSGFWLSDRLVQPDKKGPLKEPVSTAKKIRLHHNQNIFSIDFAAIDYTNPEDNRHYFMLDHYDKSWNRAGSSRRALYFNVPPGKYVFRVKAANSNGLWAEKSLDLIIVPPWWSAWWFRIPAAVLVFALLYGIIRWRMQQKFRRQLERSEREKQLADLRHKTAELEMQALRAQMNPHFIFNSLNSINRFILQNNKAQASEYLTKFSKLVRLILQNSQTPLITLESELEALQLYLELEALRFEQHFAFQIRLDEDTDEAMLKVPPLIIQPFAENAIWHGLMHKEEKGHLDIELFQENEVLCCKISDDGIGRKKATELKNRSGNTHRSMGMHITADRIALMPQQNHMKTSIQVNDLVLPDGSSGGTEVILKLPVIYD